MTQKLTALYPSWQVPQNIHAFTTLRDGGVSRAPYASFNLGEHVEDEPSAVKKNRDLLVERFGLPQFPLFLSQIHSTRVIRLPYSGEDIKADAVYTDKPGQVCLVMTADCLPVLFTSKKGNEVAAAHAGWRGLCDGVLEATVQQFHCPRDEIIAWFGPAIGPTAFQVGPEVVAQFIEQDARAERAFVADSASAGKYLGNLYQIAEQRLQRMGVMQISGGEHCTYTERDKFFSFRREMKTGRMASLIWFD